MHRQTTSERAIAIFREAGGMLRTKDVIARGIHPRTLYALKDDGVVEQKARGVYRLSDLPVSRHVSLAIVAAKYPQSVVCLISALDWHDLTLQIPHEVQIALPPGAQEPRLRYPKVKAFRVSGGALHAGVETHTIDGIDVHIYNPAKTVADCFKFRSSVGIDVALEALKNCRESRLCTLETLWHFARICRVSNIMRPYLEAVG